MNPNLFPEFSHEPSLALDDDDDDSQPPVTVTIVIECGN